MAAEIMTRGTAAFLVSEANDYRSRDTGTVVGGASPGLPAGTVLGKLTSGGNYVAYDPDVSPTDGSETVAGILYETTVGTVEATIITRDCEVNGAHLEYPSDSPTPVATTNAALLALGIVVR